MEYETMLTPGAIKYIIDRVIDNANDTLKEPVTEFTDGKRLAYYEVLDTIKNELMARNEDLAEYGLDINLEKKMFTKK